MLAKLDHQPVCTISLNIRSVTIVDLKETLMTKLMKTLMKMEPKIVMRKVMKVFQVKAASISVIQPHSSQPCPLQPMEAR